MGTDKAGLTAPGGQTYLEIAVERLATLCNEVWLSDRAEQPHRHPRVTRSIHDTSGDAGPLAAIADVLDGADAAGWPAVMVCPIDLPDLEPAHLGLILETFRREGQLTIADFDPVQPLLGIYPVTLRDGLRAELGKGRFGVNRFVRSLPHRRVTLPGWAGRNVNHPSD